MQLLFMRHGPAEPKTAWPDDESRPLTADGKLLVAEVACSLPRQARPDLILTSPLTRARQTAELVAECLEERGKVTVDKRLAPGFGPKHLEKLVRDYGDAAVLMLVGHDPDFSELVRDLTGGVRLSLRKGGLAQVDLPDLKVMKGKLVCLLVPNPASSQAGGGDAEP